MVFQMAAYFWAGELYVARPRAMKGLVRDLLSSRALKRFETFWFLGAGLTKKATSAGWFRAEM